MAQYLCTVHNCFTIPGRAFVPKPEVVCDKNLISLITLELDKKVSCRRLAKAHLILDFVPCPVCDQPLGLGSASNCSGIFSVCFKVLLKFADSYGLLGKATASVQIPACTPSGVMLGNDFFFQSKMRETVKYVIIMLVLIFNISDAPAFMMSAGPHGATLRSEASSCHPGSSLHSFFLL